MKNPATLGTLLRHLIEMLDADVEQAYLDAGLDYRPRYTPVVRALRAHGPASIRTISQQAGITHSAVSQTVSQMVARGLVVLAPGADARERLVSLTPGLERIAPRLERQWAAIGEAARSLDDELGFSLPDLLRRAIGALERRSFADRIASAAAPIEKPRKARTR